jgi:hypothetical protein
MYLGKIPSEFYNIIRFLQLGWEPWNQLGRLLRHNMSRRGVRCAHGMIGKKQKRETDKCFWNISKTVILERGCFFPQNPSRIGSWARAQTRDRPTSYPELLKWPSSESGLTSSHWEIRYQSTATYSPDVVGATLAMLISVGIKNVCSQSEGQYDKNYFRQFLPIFCEQIGYFLENQCQNYVSAKLRSYFWV